jgi:protein-disulfide isomerase
METGAPPLYRRPIGIVLLVLLIPVAVWVVWFLWQLGASLWLLRSGDVDPMAELKKRQFASTVAKTFQKAEVTEDDLARIASGNHPSLGNPDAPVTIVEFVDWDCPYCRAVAPKVQAFLRANPDRVNYILRDFPIVELHPQAMDAALAGRCVFEVADPEIYWMYHDRLFATQGSQAHTPANLRRYAQDLGVDIARYDGCLVNPKTQKTIDTSMEEGRRAGVGATPTFFFNGIAIPGDIDSESFEVIVKAAEAASTR